MGVIVLNLGGIFVRPICPSEEQRYQELMQEHHYLGSLPKISETLWYVALWGDQWVALLSFSASALKCAARDGWIGWNFRHQYDRLKLIVNNSRFLILPDWHIPNLGSRILSLCQRRLDKDWQKAFGHPVVLLETFVDPSRFLGTVYKAANWICVGNTKGFRRTRHGYSATAQSPKMVFLRPLQADARALLCQPILSSSYRIGGSKMMLNAQQMQSLPSFFAEIPDPRRAQGRRHRLATVLAIAAGYEDLNDHQTLRNDTLLQALTHARSEIAPYEFTTREPHLGVCEATPYTRFTILDLPALCAGASQGQGLGNWFLRHLHRAKALVFVLDSANETVLPEQLEILENELAVSDIDTSGMEKIIVVNVKTPLDKEQKKHIENFTMPYEVLLLSKSGQAAEITARLAALLGLA